MRQTVIATVIGALIGATLTSGAVALAVSTSSGAKACVSHSGTLGLLEHGTCGKGFRKITLGQQGPRGPQGKTGQTGPGATTQTVSLTAGNTGNFKLLDGVKTGATCQASEIDFNLLDAGTPYTAWGTVTSDNGTPGNDLTYGLITQTLSGANNLVLDLNIRAGTGPIVHINLAATRSGSTCQYSLLSTPSTSIS
jgi:hypothetical protein